MGPRCFATFTLSKITKLLISQQDLIKEKSCPEKIQYITEHYFLKHINIATFNN
jgi:hypothetical protein